MRTASVFTHHRCNQRCSYCTFRRAEDVPSFIARGAVEMRIRDAVAAGAAEITLTGGEPTMRADLEGLVAFAKARGAARVTLATNATLIDPVRAERLKAAGLDRARVNLIGFDEAVDVVTEDAGGFEATRRGIHALASAGLEVIVEVALVTSSSTLARSLPSALVRAFAGAVASLEVTIPTRSPAPSELLSYDVVPELVSALADDARAVGLAVRFTPDGAPPPCVFPQVGRVAHLFSMTRGASAREGFRRLDACADCAMRDRCAGVSESYIDRFGVPAISPVIEDRMRRRLSLIGTVAEQVARELVTHDHYSSPESGDIDEDLIRVNFHCNQSCRFCFVSTHLPAAPDATILDAIASAGAHGRRVTLTGGEPTLNPSLLAYVRHARQHSKHPIRLQTNAIRLASRELTDALVDAGVSEAFVSLHGSNATIGDAVTHAPGTYDKSVIGIDNLVARGVDVVLNFVICRSNMTDLVPYVALVAARWPRVSVNISFVAPSTDVVPREHEFIPRYTDVLPHLADALALARERGVKIVGFESMCGIPLCLVPASLDAYYGLSQIPVGSDQGEFIRAKACETCDLAGRCHGLRRGYAELHGEDELRPVRAAEAS